MVSALLLNVGMLTVSLAVAEDAAAPSDLAAYESASKVVGRDPAAHVRLALWCEAHGLRAERLKHLALAVLSDPRNVTARGLMGMVAYGGQWKRPDAVSEKVKADEILTARLAEYNGRRARTPEKADAQWSLALWCEQNGLDAEARAHFTVVTRLDPSREAAWKRLGCKKVNGRWVSETQIAAQKEEAEAQKKADKHWKPLLTKWRGWLGEKARRDEAEKALAEVTDPHAVAAVWSVFVAGTPSTHDRAVQILGQIDAPAASRALAFLAVFDDSAEVRRRATETLKQRDPREYAGMLVTLLRDPIKYEVKPVNGPGSPGALFVQGEKFNVRRQYAAPAMPYIPISPSDQFDFDIDGLPVIIRGASSATTEALSTSSKGRMSLDQFEHFNPTDPALARAVADYRANSSAIWGNFFATHRNNAALMRRDPAAARSNLGVSFNQKVSRTTTTVQQTQIPIGQIMAEYQKAAASAQQQLAQDVAMVESYNDDVTRLNGRVSKVLGEVSGQDRGEDRKSWQAWWVDLQGYSYTRSPEAPRPTLVEDVPPAYSPRPGPVFTTTQSYRNDIVQGPLTVSPYSSMPSCFGAGTLVRTLEGSRAIETIKVGDRLLTQDIKTGALGYQPVTVIHHNPPSPTFLVKVDGDTIVSSPFHRFWITGKGWVMARDLKGGELVRLLDGPARVEAVEEGPVQPVFNLDVAEHHDFFAGKAAALVHDNTLPETRLEPFDASPELVATAPSR